MALQAWIDDSGSEPQSTFFVLGGFVAQHDQWAAFSDQWQAVLDQSPKLEYFKMNEAFRLRGQFDTRRGWTEENRDRRVMEFTEIIRDHAIVRVSASIQHADYTRYIASIPMPVRKLAVDNPYVQLADQLILAVAVKSDLHGLNQPCDFYFDEQQDFSAELIANWADFKALIKTSGRAGLYELIGSQPSFRDEKIFLPLQAADLYAWHVRDHLTRNRNLIVRPGPVLRALDKIPPIHREYTTAEIQRLRDHLLGVGKAFAKANPAMPLVGPISNRRERRKAHKRARKPSGPASSSKKGQPS
jgi:hypothetical protein